MLLSYFNSLNRAQQIDAICDHGTHLLRRLDERYKISLYQIDSFYVEVYYDKKKTHITYIRAFKTTDLLEPYLEEINIASLLKT